MSRTTRAWEWLSSFLILTHSFSNTIRVFSLKYLSRKLRPLLRKSSQLNRVKNSKRCSKIKINLPIYFQNCIPDFFIDFLKFKATGLCIRHVLCQKLNCVELIIMLLCYVDYWSVFRIRILDPQDLYVFGPPRSASGSVIYLYSFGSGSFHQQAKK